MRWMSAVLFSFIILFDSISLANVLGSHAVICLFATLVLMTFENFARTPETKERTEQTASMHQGEHELQLNRQANDGGGGRSRRVKMSATKHNSTREMWIYCVALFNGNISELMYHMTKFRSHPIHTGTLWNRTRVREMTERPKSVNRTLRHNHNKSLIST